MFSSRAHNHEQLNFKSVAIVISGDPTISQADVARAKERAQASCHISTSSRQVQDEQVGRLLQEIQIGYLSSSSSCSSGQRNLAPVTFSAKYIHASFYFVDLSHTPVNEAPGWTAGRRSIKSRNDFILCLDNSALHGIRRHHAALQIHETGSILVKKISDSGVVKVDGQALDSRPFRLFNKHTSFISLGRLKYEVAYTRHSATEEHAAALSQHIRKSYRISSQLDISMTPTPAPGTWLR
ncbi:hypothetical protein NM208_g9726 [Fusarium decemcellulare]|uniref:Uncharacterized protein n=1 Tax=Fusarium decemcellulare TaxID=57161 RepID=A0ACC1S0H5_9HYPO|nr:hypothetical protein NM208_g9726 [Fusarium decemcellulare]